MGSIPTHSRHPQPAVSRGFAWVAVPAAAALLACGGVAAAQDAAGPGVAEPDTTGHHAAAPEGAGTPEPNPAGEPIEITPELFEALPLTPVSEPGPTEPGPLARAFRSALFPAWGQLTNDRPRKAVVIFAVQTYIYTRVVLETRKAREAQRRADRFAAGDQSDPDVVFAMEAAETSAQEHYDRRRDMLFWAVVGGFYGAMDAYIDAHLGHFERDLDEDRTLFGEVDAVKGEASLGLRF